MTEYYCDGQNCPSKKICVRFLNINKENCIVQFAAFWARRDKDADKCDSFVQSEEE